MMVSIHALLAECDLQHLYNIQDMKKFQSTHSLRSATTFSALLKAQQAVSIHALLAECDCA